MASFKYAPMFQLGPDTTQYYKIPGSEKLVKTTKCGDKTLLEVSPEALTLVARQSFHDCQFMLRRAHNEQVAAILKDPEASDNDKYVALHRHHPRGKRPAGLDGLRGRGSPELRGL